MALSIVQTAEFPAALKAPSQAITATFGSTPTPGNVIIAMLSSISATSGSPSIQTGWSVITFVGSGLIPIGDGTHAAFHVVQPGDTTATTPWFSVTVTDYEMTVWEVTGFLQPFNASWYLQSATFAQTSGGTGAATSTLTAAANGSLCLYNCFQSGTGGVTSGPSGFTVDFTASASFFTHWAGHELSISSGATVAPAITFTTSAKCCGIAVLLSPGTLNTPTLSAGASFAGTLLHTLRLFRTLAGAGASFAGSLVGTHIFGKVLSAGISFAGAIIHTAVTIVHPQYFFNIITDAVGSFFIARDETQSSTIATDSSDTGNTIQE